jgi:hypothetical protein
MSTFDNTNNYTATLATTTAGATTTSNEYSAPPVSLASTYEPVGVDAFPPTDSARQTCTIRSALSENLFYFMCINNCIFFFL